MTVTVTKYRHEHETRYSIVGYSKDEIKFCDDVKYSHNLVAKLYEIAEKVNNEYKEECWFEFVK